MSYEPLVYLSYSHKDQDYLDELLTLLRPLERQGDFRVWHDRDIPAGSEWHQAIHTALEQADVAFLLVSADYLASLLSGEAGGAYAAKGVS